MAATEKSVAATETSVAATEAECGRDGNECGRDGNECGRDGNECGRDGNWPASTQSTSTVLVFARMTARMRSKKYNVCCIPMMVTSVDAYMLRSNHYDRQAIHR